MMTLKHLTEKTEREYKFTVKSPRWLEWIDIFTFAPMFVYMKVKYFFKGA